jgi:hypothetical protein
LAHYNCSQEYFDLGKQRRILYEEAKAEKEALLRKRIDERLAKSEAFQKLILIMGELRRARK